MYWVVKRQVEIVNVFVRNNPSINKGKRFRLGALKIQNSKTHVDNNDNELVGYQTSR